MAGSWGTGALRRPASDERTWKRRLSDVHVVVLEPVGACRCPLPSDVYKSKYRISMRVLLYR